MGKRYTLLSPDVPGVVLGPPAEGLMCPRRSSGVLDRTLVGPGPAVEGLSPFGPEGSPRRGESSPVNVDARFDLRAGLFVADRLRA